MRTVTNGEDMAIVADSDLEAAVLARLIDARLRDWHERTGASLTVASVNPDSGTWTVEEREDALDTMGPPRATWLLWVAPPAPSRGESVRVEERLAEGGAA